MLKLKDNVNLEEVVKKYELKYDKYRDRYYCRHFTITKLEHHIMPHNGTNYDRYDLIYEMIKDNLVERVDK